jgi:hypothetical protein
MEAFDCERDRNTESRKKLRHNADFQIGFRLRGWAAIITNPAGEGEL